MLARLLRRFPCMTPASEVRALLDRQLTPKKVAAEVVYLERPSARGFERPYGWAWLLLLAAELDRHPKPRWAETLRPLAEAIAARLRTFLPKAHYPVRTGAHGNTAFALLLAHAYATAGDPTLVGLLRAKAEAWYGRDAGCPAWGEPGSDDFLSPTLVEAACMACLMPAEEFRPWLERFLPHLGARRPAALFEPVAVSDRADGKIVHLDGLNLSRAWCWRLLARALPATDTRRLVMEEAARTHLAASLPHVAGDYAGEHWLASFAVLALEPVTPAGGPEDGVVARPR